MCAAEAETQPAAIEVCAGVIRRNGLVLLAQRPPGGHLPGKWEFPGGKRHPGETLQECIRRELAEELGVEISDAVLLQTVEHAYPDKLVRLFFLACQITPGQEPRNLEGQEHGWFHPGALAELDVVPADRGFLAWLAADMQK